MEINNYNKTEMTGYTSKAFGSIWYQLIQLFIDVEYLLDIINETKGLFMIFEKKNI